MVIEFDHFGGGLIVGEKSGLAPLVEVKGGVLEGFAVAGADKKWHWADARIVGNTVEVPAPRSRRRRRYGTPAGAIPAAPTFTTAMACPPCRSAPMRGEHKNATNNNRSLRSLMNVKQLCLAALLGLFLLASPAWAKVKIAGVFGDNMVLQRGCTVPVWGWADAGDEIAVVFGGQARTVRAAADGAWRVDLDPMPASVEPRTLTVRSKADNLEANSKTSSWARYGCARASPIWH